MLAPNIHRPIHGNLVGILNLFAIRSSIDIVSHNAIPQNITRFTNLVSCAKIR